MLKVVQWTRTLIGRNAKAWSCIQHHHWNEPVAAGWDVSNDRRSVGRSHSRCLRRLAPGKHGVVVVAVVVCFQFLERIIELMTTVGSEPMELHVLQRRAPSHCRDELRPTVHVPCARQRRTKTLHELNDLAAIHDTVCSASCSRNPPCIRRVRSDVTELN